MESDRKCARCETKFVTGNWVYEIGKQRYCSWCVNITIVESPDSVPQQRQPAYPAVGSEQSV